ncbi:Ig domain-containing protein [Aliiglaciecola sp. LCG003]|uniref:Ig domain-containing protein n=1 Tax=Aliiglaciecola sp. LCG003 TaxID=3053655 RepID=UPI002573764A|nr:Ig domain-containing protein [Aliiglaciecola sp. LCG003]WJG09963.1 Ig domain-containing protein [Aliiglaciecola sp. LCG003]
MKTLQFRKSIIFACTAGLLFFAVLSHAQVCDVDSDNDVDRFDIGHIFQARNQNAIFDNDPRDENADGRITLGDARACVLHCTAGRCAPIEDPNPLARATLIIVDTFGTPIPFAVIERLSDGEQATTDNSGVGELAAFAANSQSVVSVRANGYAKGVARLDIGPAQSSVSQRIVLRRRELAKQAPVDAEVWLVGMDGTSVMLPANGFVDQQGNRVTGNIGVFMTPVDVSVDELGNGFPGLYAGIPENESSEFPLVSFGVVEFFFAQNGQELQLAQGESAGIVMPLYLDIYPDGSSVQVGDEIPLWYLNEETAVWEQQGIGRVVLSPHSTTGLALQAEVQHFSWWNIDLFGGGDSDNPNLPKNFKADVTVVTPQSYAGFTTYALLRASSSAVRSISSRTVSLNTPKTLFVFEGQTCFSARAFVVLDGLSEFIGESERVCGSFVSEQDNHQQIDLLIDTDLPFRGAIVAPLCSVVEQPFGPAIVKGIRGSAPFTYHQSSGFPSGLAVDSRTGIISGTPTDVGIFNLVTIIEEHNGDNHVLPAYSVEIADLLTISIDFPDDLQLGDFIETEPPVVSGGCSPYRYKLAEGDLPDGLMVDSRTGVISGIPTSAGTSTFTLEVFDGSGSRAQTESQEVIFGQPILVSAQIATLTPGQSWSYNVSDMVLNQGGDVISYSVTNLPSWLEYNDILGVLTGTPLIEGQYQFDITGSNEAGQSTVTVTLTVLMNLLPPANISAVALGDALQLAWQEVEGINEYQVTVSDLADNILEQFIVSGGQAWLTGLPLNTEFSITLASVLNGEFSEPSAAIISPQLSGVQTILLQTGFGERLFQPDDMQFDHANQDLLLIGNRVVRIPLENPAQWTIVSSQGQSLKGVSSAYVNADMGYVFSSQFSASAPFSVSWLLSMQDPVQVVGQLPLLPGERALRPSIVQGNVFDNLIALNVKQDNTLWWRVMSQNFDGSSQIKLNSNQVDWPLVAPGLTIRNDILYAVEPALVKATNQLAVPIQAGQNLQTGSALVLVDELQNAPAALPSMFPLQNCFSDFDDGPDNYLAAEISEVADSSSNNLLIFAQNSDDGLGGLVRLDTASGDCQMLLGQSVTEGQIGDAGVFRLNERSQVELKQVNSNDVLVLIRNDFDSFPIIDYKLYVFSLLEGNLTQLMNIQYDLGNFD